MSVSLDLGEDSTLNKAKVKIWVCFVIENDFWTPPPLNYVHDDLLEDVQKRVVRITAGLKPGTYQDKLKELGLPSLDERRRRGDMIQTWKILHQHDDVCEQIWFTRLNTASTVSTRLNSFIFNLEMKRTNLNIRKNFFLLELLKAGTNCLRQ